MIVRTVRYEVPDSGVSVNSPGRLIVRRLVSTPSRGIAGRRRRSSDAVPVRNSELARFRKAGIVGGLDATSVSPILEYGDTGEVDASLVFCAWEVAFRQVMFCPISEAAAVKVNRHLRVPPVVSYPVQPVVSVRVTPAPTRTEVMQAVARGLSYPGALMTGDDRTVRVLLACRRAGGRQRRLTTLFGDLYGARAKGVR